MPQDPTLLFVKEQLFEDLLEMGKAKEVKIDKLLEMSDLMREKNSHPYDLSGRTAADGGRGSKYYLQIQKFCC